MGSKAAHCQNWSALCLLLRTDGSLRTLVDPPVNDFPASVDWLIRMSLLQAPAVLTPSYSGWKVSGL